MRIIKLIRWIIKCGHQKELIHTNSLTEFIKSLLFLPLTIKLYRVLVLFLTLSAGRKTLLFMWSCVQFHGLFISFVCLFVCLFDFLSNELKGILLYTSLQQKNSFVTSWRSFPHILSKSVKHWKVKTQHFLFRDEKNQKSCHVEHWGKKKNNKNKSNVISSLRKAHGLLERGTSNNSRSSFSITITV